MSYSPFLFTSEKEISETGKWYAMWVNPSSVELNWDQNQKEILTKSGFEYQHWQQALPKLMFSGVSGWLLPRFWNEVVTSGELQFSPHVHPEGEGSSGYGRLEAFGRTLKSTDSAWDTAFRQIAIQPGGYENNSIEASNDARLFLSRLQKVALQEKFFYDLQKGFKRFNYKKLTFFTKNYPSGLTVQGIFTKFSINEDALDSQAIPYSAEFMIQQGMPIQLGNEIEMLTPQVDLTTKWEKKHASEA